MSSTSGGGDASKFVSHPGVDKIYEDMIDLAFQPAASRKEPSSTTEPPPTGRRREARSSGRRREARSGGHRPHPSRRGSVGRDPTASLGPTRTPEEYAALYGAIWKRRTDEILVKRGDGDDGEGSSPRGRSPGREEASPDPPSPYVALQNLVREVQRENEGGDGIPARKKGDGRKSGNQKNVNGNNNYRSSSSSSSNSRSNIKEDKVVDLLRNLVRDVRRENDGGDIISPPMEGNGKEGGDKSSNNGNNDSNNGNGKSSSSGDNNNNGNTKKDKAPKTRPSLCPFKVSPNQAPPSSSRGAAKLARRSSTGFVPPSRGKSRVAPDDRKLPGPPKNGLKLTRRASAGFAPPPRRNDGIAAPAIDDVSHDGDSAPFVVAGPTSQGRGPFPPPPPRPSGEGAGKSPQVKDKKKKKASRRRGSTAELATRKDGRPPRTSRHGAPVPVPPPSAEDGPPPKNRALRESGWIGGAGRVPPSVPPSREDAALENGGPTPPPRDEFPSSPSGASVGGSAISGASSVSTRVEEAPRPKVRARRHHSMLDLAPPSLPGSRRPARKEVERPRRTSRRGTPASIPSAGAGGVPPSRDGPPREPGAIGGTGGASNGTAGAPCVEEAHPPEVKARRRHSMLDFAPPSLAGPPLDPDESRGTETHAATKRDARDKDDRKLRPSKASRRKGSGKTASRNGGPAPPPRGESTSSLSGESVGGSAISGASSTSIQVEEACRPKVRAQRRHSMLNFATPSLTGPPFDPGESRGTEKDAATKRDAVDKNVRKLGPSEGSRQKARCGRPKYIRPIRGIWQASEDWPQDFSQSDAHVNYSDWDAAMERYRAEREGEGRALRAREDGKNPEARVRGPKATAIGGFARRCSTGAARAAAENARTEQLMRFWKDEVNYELQARRGQEEGRSPRAAAKNTGTKIRNDTTNEARGSNDARQEEKKQDCKKNISLSQQTVDMVNNMAELHNLLAGAGKPVRRCSMEDGALQAALENVRANEFVQDWKGKSNEVHRKPQQEKQQDCNKGCLPSQRTVDMAHDVAKLPNLEAGAGRPPRRCSTEDCAVPVALEDARTNNFVQVCNDKKNEAQQKLDASNVTRSTKTTKTNTASSSSENDASASVTSAANPHRDVPDVYVRSDADGGEGLDDSVSTLGESIRSWEDRGTVRMYHNDIGREYSGGMSLGSLGNVRQSSSIREVKETNSPAGVAECVNEGGKDPEAIPCLVVPASPRASCRGDPQAPSSPGAAEEGPAVPGDARRTDRDLAAERIGFFESARARSALELVRRGKLRVRHARRRQFTDCAVIEEESWRAVRDNLEAQRGRHRRSRHRKADIAEEEEEEASANDCEVERNAALRRLLQEHGAFLSDVEERHQCQ